MLNTLFKANDLHFFSFPFACGSKRSARPSAGSPSASCARLINEIFRQYPLICQSHLLIETLNILILRFLRQKKCKTLVFDFWLTHIFHIWSDTTIYMFNKKLQFTFNAWIQVFISCWRKKRVYEGHTQLTEIELIFASFILHDMKTNLFKNSYVTTFFV